MDVLSGLEKAYNTGSEIFGDYQRGKKIRLGQYNGVDSVKKLGHYKVGSGKRLGIYHG